MGAAQVTAKDLLGDPAPATPPMSAPLPWRVYVMNDCDWWVARSVDEARLSYKQNCDVEELDVYELTDEQMDKLHFVDTDHYERPLNRTRRTFRAELAQRVTAGLSAPELFASSEY